MDETIVLRLLQRERRVIAAFFFLSGIISATWSARIPDVQLQLGLNKAQLGWVLSALPAGLLTGMALVSWLIAGKGIYRVAITSCFSLCLFLVLAGGSTTGWQLAAALFLLGMSRTIFNISINTAALEVQKQFQKPFVSSLHGLWSLACLVAAGIGFLAIRKATAPLVHFLLLAVIVAGIAAWLYRFLPRLGGTAEKRPFFVMPDRQLFLLGCIACCAMLAEGAVFDWSVLYFRDAVHAPKAWTIAGYAAFITTMTTGRLTGDRLLAKFGAHSMLVMNALVMAAGFLILALFPGMFLSIAGFLLIGAGDSILVPVIYTLAARSEKMPPSYALASVTLIGYTGFLAGPPLIGSVAKAWDLRAAFGLLSVAALVMLALILLLRRRS